MHVASEQPAAEGGGDGGGGGGAVAAAEAWQPLPCKGALDVDALASLEMCPLVARVALQWLNWVRQRDAFVVSAPPPEAAADHVVVCGGSTAAAQEQAPPPHAAAEEESHWGIAGGKGAAVAGTAEECPAAAAAAAAEPGGAVPEGAAAAAAQANKDDARPIYVRALADYETTDESELCLMEDELVEVMEQDDSGWWRGRTLRRGIYADGWFPCTYVEWVGENATGIAQVYFANFV